MQIKTAINEQLNKPMSRRQFLEFSGGLILAVLGITNLMQYFLNAHRHLTPQQPVQAQSSTGFGSRKFGV